MGKREREGSWRDVGRERERRSEQEREMIYALIVSQRVENLQLSRMRGSLLQVLFFFFLVFFIGFSLVFPGRTFCHKTFGIIYGRARKTFANAVVVVVVGVMWETVTLIYSSGLNNCPA